MRLERAQLGLLAALSAAIPVSIFAAETLLVLSLLVLAARLATGRTRLPRTAVDTPLLAMVVWTLLAASFATNPAHSHEDAKKLVLYALFYLGIEVLTREGDRARVGSAVLLGGVALAASIVVQHVFLGFDHLSKRPHGFLGHYMSAAGVTMGVLLLATARLAYARRPLPRIRDAWLAGLVLAGVAVAMALDGGGQGVTATRLFVLGLVLLAGTVALARHRAVQSAEDALPLVAAPLAAWALLATQTRNAWLGAFVGLAVVAVLRAPRLLWLLGGAVAALLLLRPADLKGRLTLEDASTIDRYYMWQAGIDMVLDRPVFGQGPGMILEAYPRYRWPQAPNPQQPHLHNNLLEVAAERGLPGLAFFLWWAALVGMAALREARRARGSPPAQAQAAVGALALLVAILVAGLFEYNLGDSEVLMLVLLVAAVPFALQRESALA